MASAKVEKKGGGVNGHEERRKGRISLLMRKSTIDSAREEYFDNGTCDGIVDVGNDLRCNLKCDF